MIIYVCIKVGTQQDGAFTAVSAEGAFKTREKAETLFRNRVKEFKEIIDGSVYDCIRAIHEIELED